jgi:hypothetical protein
MTYTSQGASHDSNETASVGGKYDSMNEDGPNGSPYETLVKHDQSETNVTLPPFQGRCPHCSPFDIEEVPVLSLQMREYISHLEAADTT